MLNDSWQFLIQDVSLAGGFHSPMLSWLGAAGILALCLWHSFCLIRGVSQIRQAFSRIQPALARLLGMRRQASKEWIVISALPKKQAQPAHAHGARADLDDLQELDRAMRAEPMFADEWLSYRKTFSVEQSSWFIEPTVHTERSAAEFFSFETLCGNRLNVRFYQQLPSFMTGIGLMCTFLAILIGLSKLHANGSEIEGIQGLINGLAGKFVTSVVGLACANMFMLLEKSLWYRLAGPHRRILSQLDEMFPKKVQDQSLPHGGASDRRAPMMSGGFRNDPANELIEAVHQRLGTMVASLTSMSQSLSSLSAANSKAGQERLACEIGQEVQKALGSLIAPLLAVIRDLSRAVENQRSPAQLSSREVENLFDGLRKRLDGETPVTTSGPRRPGNASGSWLHRLRRNAAEETRPE